MKRILPLACLLSVPMCAQMEMPMPGMPDHPAPAPHKTLASKHSQLGSPSPQPAPPFGKVADGDTSQTPRIVPATPSPIHFDERVQEQEHPDRVTGSTETPTPDLLADVKARPAQALPFFEQKAMANNPTLRQAEAQIKRLRAQAKQAGLWDNPEIGYEADHIRGGSYHSGEQGGYLQQTIPLAGQRSTARAAFQAQAKQAEAVLQQQQERVRSAVEEAFYAALVAQREAELRAQIAEIASESTGLSHQLANIGQADAPDVLQTEVEREQAKLDLATAQRGYRKAFAALAAVSGDSSIPITPLTGDLTAVPVIPESTTAQAADDSLSVRVAQQGVSAGDAAVHSAQRQVLPQLTLRAGLQQDNEPLDFTRARVGVVGVAQVGVTLPLWNRNQGSIEAAKAERLSAEAEVKRTQLTLRMQAERTMQDYADAMGQAQCYRDELLPRAERAAQLYRQKYAAMAAAYPQVLASQRSLLQLQMGYVHALGSAWQSAILLQHGLLDGGLTVPEQVGLQGRPSSE